MSQTQVFHQWGGTSCIPGLDKGVTLNDQTMSKLADTIMERAALDEVKKLGRGQPELSNAHIAELEAVLANAEAEAL